jgi:membrane-bound lytic murein transglycosylase B
MLKRALIIISSICIITIANGKNAIFPVKNIDDFKNIMINKYNIPEKKIDPIITQIRQNLKSAQAKNAVKSIKNPAEKKTWDNYRQIFIQKKRINQGIRYINTHHHAFKMAIKKYKVNPEVITAITGVETNYGKHKGRYNALYALGSLAFNYPKRAKFFQRELAEYISLTYHNNIDPLSIKSSYAGALGIPQFMPSSYIAYAVNENGIKSGNIDLINNHNDSIMSIANYLSRHKWNKSEFIAKPISINNNLAKVKNIINKKKAYHTAEWYETRGIQTHVFDKNLAMRIITLNTKDVNNKYWLVTKDFDAIMSYNPRINYAMAIFQLSQEIKKHSQLVATNDRR